ncbi:MAG: ABC transporter ATP-binding protein [Oscillospiraceae bacterium]|jgi:simple sugar transport system ATP-binding protein|nr:ABC transporter ATP-binding protein [Oscillospiraceae bacterium]
MENIVEMRGVTKRFPGVVANDDISLKIRRGEIFALLGENGAGKSTLMSMLFGLYEPDEGEIFIRGERVRITSPTFAAGLSIGMVHQHFRLVENFTIAENIVLGAEPVRRKLGFLPYVDMRAAGAKIAELSRRYGLEVEPEAVIEDVGISIRQRVEILKMLYREAEILIFDEPTAMLAPQEIEYLLQILKNLRESGKTVILITHKLEEIKKTADRCGILSRGKLVGVYDVAETSTDEMASLMVGRELAGEAAPEEHEFGAEVLRVEKLDVIRDRMKKVDGVSFSVREGEIFAVAGVDGNGQTELTDAIAGLLRSSGGAVTLGGEDLTRADVRERMEKGISYVPEDRHGVGLLLDFTLGDNLTMRRYYEEPFSRRGIRDERAIAEYADRLIERYDIRSGRGYSTVVRSMSGGNQQKAIVAREIELDSRLLIFVQPTRGLDIGATRAIHEHILNQRAAGKAILLVSLELEEILALADTIGVMYGGRMNRVAAARELSIDEVGAYMTGVRQ